MTQQSYGNPQLDRSEMFAIGAAAGAVITAAINEYLERRRPKTAWERAQARSADALEALSATAKQSRKRVQRYVEGASDYAHDVLDRTPTTWNKTKKNANKARNQASKQVVGLKEAAVAALGTVAVDGVVDKVRDYASSAAERVVGDPHAVSGSIRETIKDSLGSVNLTSSTGTITDRAREVGGSALESLKTVATTTADTVKDYASTARETLKDAEFGDKARTYSDLVAGTVKEYASTARETLKDAKISEKTRDYTGVLTDTVKEYSSTARETLKDAKLGNRAKDYATAAGTIAALYSAEASRVAKQSATKLSDSASHLAEATGEQAEELREGVRKSVKRTRRRTRWGLRSFIIGLVVGLLTAPQSGQNTRDALTSFFEDLLDVFMPEDRQSGQASL